MIKDVKLKLLLLIEFIKFFKFYFVIFQKEFFEFLLFNTSILVLVDVFKHF